MIDPRIAGVPAKRSILSIRPVKSVLEVRGSLGGGLWRPHHVASAHFLYPSREMRSEASAEAARPVPQQFESRKSKSVFPGSQHDEPSPTMQRLLCNLHA